MRVSALTLTCWFASLFPAWFAVKRALYAHRLASWGTTKGKIIGATVEPVGSGDGYKVEMRYEFEVGGNKYVSSQTDLGLLSTRCINRKLFQTEFGAKEYAQEILAAPEVEVSFNPENPSQCILDRSFPVLFVAILVLCSAALLVIGTIFL